MEYCLGSTSDILEGLFHAFNTAVNLKYLQALNSVDIILAPI